MKLIHASPQTTRSQAGYALLMVIFLASILLIALSVAAPNLLTQGKRDKEEELIWRGEQYARAVRLYYRKFGRFPQALEDLTQAKNQIRFMRKAYKDPMNAEDGSWRRSRLCRVARPRLAADLRQPLRAAHRQRPATQFADWSGR